MNNSDFSFLESFGLLSPELLSIGKGKKVVVGMSGGVDSSVTALILKAQGFEVIGLFMKNWDEEVDGQCPAEADFNDVELVCQSLDIPYYSLDFTKEYQQRVFDSFVEGYQAGRTPNPDILCNREIKFDVFFKAAMRLGADYLATGHYCQTDGLHLLRGRDQSKDQSYFLHAIDASVLAEVLFPIGSLLKSDVRKIAEFYKLNVAKKKDSTGICFIGERPFQQFLSQYVTSQKGPFVHLDSHKVLGPHAGACFYTRGQRKGLGLGGPGGPWYVSGKDLVTNAVYVVEGENHPALFYQELFLDKVHWLTSQSSKNLVCKIRYRQADQECVLKNCGRGYQLTFSKEQRAPAIGQYVVFYQGDICLGGGEITGLGPSLYERSLLVKNPDTQSLSHSLV